MLPDQVHNREEDWTIFFLHKGPDDGEPDGEAGLMYVLSLVNKKLDQSVKRCHTFPNTHRPFKLTVLIEVP